MTPFANVNRVTSVYGKRTYTYNGKTITETHRGQDMVPTRTPGEAVDESAWNVREVTGGTVLRIASDASRGNYVDVQTAAGVFERYQHLKTVLVKVGQTVKQGDVIAVAGSTGQSTGRHLHFGVYKGGSAEANAVLPSAWSGVPNALGIFAGNDDKDAAEPEEKQYKATVLVDGLRLRAYPDAEGESVQLDLLTKGASYDVAQTKNKWAFLKTSETAGGWACIENADGEFLKIVEA